MLIGGICHRRSGGALVAFALCALSALLGPPAQAQELPSTKGSWSAVEPTPISSTHTSMLPNGLVLFWGEYDDGNAAYLWDPATDTLTPTTQIPYNAFCSGHMHLADGSVFTAGGHTASHVGLANASYYNAAARTWTEVPEMNDLRWYPSVIALANGDPFVVSGEISGTGMINLVSQVFEVATGQWRDLTAVTEEFPYYPRIMLAPNGKVFVAGTDPEGYYIDTSGEGALETAGTYAVEVEDRTYGPAVMYDAGKLILIGGGKTPSATTELIDLNTNPPTRSAGPSMSTPRRQHNATALPDGTVLVTGGSSGDEFNDRDKPVPAAELWDPVTNTWTLLAELGAYRGYHSTGLLLPDGRVFTGGGRGKLDLSAQVFSPPYLFKSARPQIVAAPERLWPGTNFPLQTADASAIGLVTLIRLGSVTHSFNMDQRMQRLTFSASSPTELSVAAPKDNNLAPAGFYMLFAVDKSGVPSVAKMVQVLYGPTAGTPDYAVLTGGGTASPTPEPPAPLAEPGQPFGQAKPTDAPPAPPKVEAPPPPPPTPLATPERSLAASGKVASGCSAAGEAGAVPLLALALALLLAAPLGFGRRRGARRERPQLHVTQP